MKFWFLGAALLLVTPSAFADLADELSHLVGYTIIDTKTIEGWYDEDGKKGDSFEGCEFGRTIVFSDNRVLRCSEYNYQYSSMPTAIILSNGQQFKMIVEDTVYDMQR
jgi:hypothetical protein